MFREHSNSWFAVIAFISFVVFWQRVNSLNPTISAISKDGRMLQAKHFGWTTQTAINLIQNSLSQTELEDYLVYARSGLPLVSALLNAQWMVVSLSVLIPEESSDTLGWLNLLPFLVGIAEITEHFCVGTVLQELTTKQPMSVATIAAGAVGGMCTIVKYWLGLALVVLIGFRVATMLYNSWAETRSTDDFQVAQPLPPQDFRRPNQKKSFIDKGLSAIGRFLAEATTKKGDAVFHSMGADEYDAKENEKKGLDNKSIDKKGSSKGKNKKD